VQTPPERPTIGVDEWVARAEERTQIRRGPLGAFERAWNRLPPAARLAIVVGGAALFAVATSNQYYQRVGFNVLIYAMLALGLNVVVGWAGLLDLGYVAFWGFGAYAYALLDSERLGLHWPPLGTMAIVVVAAALLGVLVGLPSRRLVGDYLAIITLFFGQIFFNLANNLSLTHGPNGLTNLDPLSFFGFHVTTVRAYYYTALMLFAIIVIVLWLVNNSRTGRAWRSLREDPLAAQLLGMPINPLKLMAFAFGAAVAALTGTVFAALQVNIFPQDFYLQQLITLYVIVILGGAGSMTGVVLGAFTIEVVFNEILSTPHNARLLFYVVLGCALVLWLRPWRWVALVAGGTIALGFAVNAIVTSLWPSGTQPLQTSGQSADLSGWVVELTDPTKVGSYAYGGLVAGVLGLTLVRGPLRKILLVPLIYLAAFVWENELVINPAVTAMIMLGALLVALMILRPTGLLGKERVEVS
jgi:ABC-type branched-subunit amino acid transport system permease subunit